MFRTSTSFGPEMMNGSTVESGVNLKSVTTKLGVLKVLVDLRDLTSTGTPF